MQLLKISHLQQSGSYGSSPVIRFRQSGAIALSLQTIRLMIPSALTSEEKIYLHIFLDEKKEGISLGISINTDSSEGISIRFDSSTGDRAQSKNIVCSAKKIVRHLTTKMDWPLGPDKLAFIKYNVQQEDTTKIDNHVIYKLA